MLSFEWSSAYQIICPYQWQNIYKLFWILIKQNLKKSTSMCKKKHFYNEK